MTRHLPNTNATDEDGDPVKEWLQYRGPATSVMVDAYGIRFSTEIRGDQVVHEPLPVVDPDADPDAVPDNAVARPVAEDLVESTALINWGVVCEHVDQPDDDPCGEVFGTLKGEETHRRMTHGDGEADEDEGGGDADE